MVRGLVVNEANSFVNAFKKDIHMYTKAVCMSAWPVLGAAIVSCALFARSCCG